MTFAMGGVPHAGPQQFTINSEMKICSSKFNDGILILKSWKLMIWFKTELKQTQLCNEVKQVT